MKRTIAFTAVAIVALLLTSTASANRKARGSCVLTGIVLGPDDKPVPHASVSYQSSGGNEPHALRADASGHFKITALVADNYDMRATSKGIFSEWEKNVTVRRGAPTNITLRLIYARQMPNTKPVGKNKRSATL
ncbi:MAG: hypothetical protein PVS2B2_25330 [Candidatus Acidiferrum sp.]